MLLLLTITNPSLCAFQLYMFSGVGLNTQGDSEPVKKEMQVSALHYWQ